MTAPHSKQDSADKYWLTHKDKRQRTHFGRGPSERETGREELMLDWFGEDAGALEVLERQETYASISRGVDEAMLAIGQGYSVTLNQVREKWPELVGSGIAAKARPATLFGKTLNIEVENSTWMQVLRSDYTAAILKAVIEVTGDKVNQIRFVPAGRQRREEDRKRY